MVLLLYCIVGFALTQTAWGRHIFAVGDDIESARLSGVASKRILLSVYTVAGLVYGFAAWIQIGRAGSARPTASRTPTSTASPLSSSVARACSVGAAD